MGQSRSVGRAKSFSDSSNHTCCIAVKPLKQTVSTRKLGWSSGNWSGYARTGVKGHFHSIAGKWLVPSVQPNRNAMYSSTWIGIDGFNNNHLIQTGTEQDYFNGKSHYYAWWEILPRAEQRISHIAVRPGDVMYAEIRKLGSEQWAITIRNLTNGGHFVTVQSYSGPQTSVEWIQEAPLVNGKISRLARYSPTVFDRISVNRGNPGLVVSNGGGMIGRQGALSTPSNPDSDRDGFALRYGATIPRAPVS